MLSGIACSMVSMAIPDVEILVVRLFSCSLSQYVLWHQVPPIPMVQEVVSSKRYGWCRKLKVVKSCSQAIAI